MKTMKDRIDPELLPSLEMMNSAGLDRPFTSYEDLLEYRAKFIALDKQARANLPPFEGVQITEHSVKVSDGAEISVRVTKPTVTSDQRPVLLWIHGGGYIIGSAEQSDPTTSNYAKEANCVVVSVDYRLAPEFPFPTPLEDCYSALKWTVENSSELNIDPKRIVVGGQSAGAGLAAGLAQIARDRGEVSLIFQLLYYPMLDDRTIEPASDSVQDTVIWTRGKNHYAWGAYLGQTPGTESTPKYAAPGRTKDLTNLPPTYLMSGDLDLFLNENLDYARRLIEAGVPTDLHIYKGGYHGFDSFAPLSGIGIRSNTDSLNALKQAMHGGQVG